jgi:hypothetical protein
MDEDMNNVDRSTSITEESAGSGIGASGGSAGGSTSGGSTTGTTTTTRNTGVCQANADCGSGFICDTRNPTYPTGDLTNPFGQCVQCTPVNTFLRCEPETGIAIYANGNCGEKKSTGPDGNCPPPKGLFIECNKATAKYHDGLGGFTYENNAKICIDKCEKDNVFIQCKEGTTTAIVHDGKCDRREIQNDSRCITRTCDAKDKFLGCEGTSGKYADGDCGFYVVQLDTKVNKVNNVDTVCYTAPPASGSFLGCAANTYTAQFANGTGGIIAVQNSPRCGYISSSGSPASVVNTFTIGVAQQNRGTVLVTYSDSDTVQNNRTITVASTTTLSFNNSGSARYPIQLTAQPANGYRFSGWTRDTNYTATGNQPVLSGFIRGNSSIVANFIAVETGSSSNPPLQNTPTPTPTPTWRSCVDGTLNNGTPPTGYRNVVYNGPAGGTCWEPETEIGFNPPLNQALTFFWRRGQNYPSSIRVNATNSSYSSAYSITINTNENITIIPRSFVINPRSTETFSVLVTPTLLAGLGDGTSVFDARVEILEL